jgi:hypothetical protein
LSTTEVTLDDPADNPCQCAWDALEETIPAEEYRQARAADEAEAGSGELPPEFAAEMQAALAPCMPDFSSTP